MDKRDIYSNIALKPTCCDSCKEPIVTRYLLKINSQYWHENCLTCKVCNLKLSENCFEKDNQMLCKSDYKRLHGCRCSRCKELLSPNDLVMKALQNIYHVDCFKCDECGDKLEKGDEFILKENKLYCSADFNVAENKVDIDVISSDEIDSMSTTSPKSPNKLDDKDNGNGCKRPRTILTSQQRADFKAAFEITPKPCRKVRENLSNDTGLSVRVVQVWFQNQRAKLKKLQKRQEGGESPNEKIKKVNHQGKITKKKRIKSSSSSKSSEMESQINFNFSNNISSQFPHILDISENYPTSSSNTNGTSSNHQLTSQRTQQLASFNRNRNIMLTEQSSDFLNRASYAFDAAQENTNQVTNLHSVYGSDYQLSTTNHSVPITSHFQMMPHLMNSFL